jgi:hypothetical protein
MQALATQQELPPDLKAVRELVLKVLASQPDDAPDVLDYVMADLKGDGSRQLVCRQTIPDAGVRRCYW